MKHNQWNLSGILIIQDWIRPTSLSLISKEIRLWAFFRIPYSTINYGSFTNEAGRLSSLEFFISCSCVKRRGKSLVNAALNPGKREEKKRRRCTFRSNPLRSWSFLGASLPIRRRCFVLLPNCIERGSAEFLMQCSGWRIAKKKKKKKEKTKKRNSNEIELLARYWIWETEKVICANPIWGDFRNTISDPSHNISWIFVELMSFSSVVHVMLCF